MYTHDFCIDNLNWSAYNKSQSAKNIFLFEIWKTNERKGDKRRGE